MAEKKANTPKVRYQGKTYEVVGRSGSTIRIKDEVIEFCILADLTTPTNKEAREMFKGMV